MCSSDLGVGEIELTGDHHRGGHGLAVPEQLLKMEAVVVVAQ